MEAFTVAALVALGVIVTDLIKPYIPKSIPTIPVAWVVNIALLALGASANAFDGQELFGHALNSLDGQSLVIGGLLIGSTGSTLVKTLKAFDNSDTQVVEKGTAYDGK